MFKKPAVAVLRGLLGYKRVGFQTRKDCANFIGLCEKYLDSDSFEVLHFCETPGNTVFTVRFGDWLSDVGTFPISIKIGSIQQMCNAKENLENATKLRSKLISGGEGKIFLSVERFDYTKGIVERMKAIENYFLKFPERKFHDVFYQIAAASRGDISAYKIYQNQVRQMVQEMNEKFGNENWNPVILDTVNHPQDEGKKRRKILVLRKEEKPK